jgi:hypothetical protein
LDKRKSRSGKLMGDSFQAGSFMEVIAGGPRGVTRIPKKP